MTADSSAGSQFRCPVFKGGAWTMDSIVPAKEVPLTIYVNGEEFGTLLCSPGNFRFLALGHLFAEGLVTGLKDVAFMRVCDDELEVDIRLNDSSIKPARAKTLTSGCGGGGSTQSELSGELRLSSDIRVSPSELICLMRKLVGQERAYRQRAGVHTSALADQNDLLMVVDDIGRHNTLDRIIGECLFKGISTKDKVLIGTGRVSSEMIVKSYRMGTPIVISRNSLTDRAVVMADKLGITAVGYARGTHFTVYACPERVAGAETSFARAS